MPNAFNSVNNINGFNTLINEQTQGSEVLGGGLSNVSAPAAPIYTSENSSVASPTSNVGPQGPQGLPGAQGPQGPQGPQGLPGADSTVPGPAGVGPSAYQTAVDLGFAGTEQQWLDSLIGPPGAAGLTGPIGPAGNNGLSAYESYLFVNGPGLFETETQWLASLVGASGTNGTNGTNGVDGKTILSGITAPTTEGVDGDFYIDTASNFIYGPKAAGIWPAGVSIVGPQGATGPSGSQGIQGIQGPQGLAGADGNGFTLTAPTTSKGATGDTVGKVAIDANFIYYCTAAYTDGLSDIWSRTPLSVVATW